MNERQSDAWLEQFMVGDPEDDGVHVFPPKELSFAIIPDPYELDEDMREPVVVMTPTEYMRLENGEWFDQPFQIEGLDWPESSGGIFEPPEGVDIRQHLLSLGMTEDVSLAEAFDDGE